MVREEVKARVAVRKNKRGQNGDVDKEIKSHIL
jgi:hypothetical protein